MPYYNVNKSFIYSFFAYSLINNFEWNDWICLNNTWYIICWNMTLHIKSVLKTDWLSLVLLKENTFIQQKNTSRSDIKIQKKIFILIYRSILHEDVCNLTTLSSHSMIHYISEIYDYVCTLKFVENGTKCSFMGFWKLVIKNANIWNTGHMQVYVTTCREDMANNQILFQQRMKNVHYCCRKC